MPRYALYVVPDKVPREKLALLRRQLCKRFGSHKALLYPIHLTLTRGVELSDVEAFLREVRDVCATQRPMTLSAGTTLVSGPYAAGVKVKNTPSLTRFQATLQKIADRYALTPSTGSFDPHLSLVYGTRITGVEGIINPVKTIRFDRVSVAVQEREDAPSRVVEELPLGRKKENEE